MDFKVLLEQLHAGEIDEFQVTTDTYREFYDVWRDYPYQNTIRGIADLDGVVTYVRQTES